MSHASELEELRSELTSLKAEMRRMESCIVKFQAEYEPLLSAMKVNNSYWGGVRREVLLHALKGSVWAFLAAFAIVVGLGLQKWAKGFLA